MEDKIEGGNKYSRVKQSTLESHRLTFNFRFTKYYFGLQENCFIPIVFDVEKSYEEIHQLYAGGISFPEEYEDCVEKFGKCDIQLPPKGVFKILVQEILTPFYLFQFFSLASWFAYDYYVYASCILATSIVSITVELIDIKKNINKLKKMAQYCCDVTVYRTDSKKNLIQLTIPSSELVPGDIFDVPEQ